MTHKEKTPASISIVVRAADPVSLQGAEVLLHRSEGATLLPAEQTARADVVLLLANEVTEETMSWMEEAATVSANPEMRIVLVADRISRPRLARAVRHGLVSVLPRAQTGFAEILQAVLTSRTGGAQMPGELLRALVEELRTLLRDPTGAIVPGGFEGREVEVLRLLAEGLDTTEIAAKLSYSERTIKNIIFAVTRRLNLRNRTHAVAYAMRIGAL
ncbi:helix-turn-helix transcriptional regulator [Streptomyces sp. NBC_01455]|uniref:helix-turn-helix transcriptional regulator n=1 Tax=Streptomyces sp. NBC_01455 TaxID=2903874 RepID=UPI002E3130B3|nr:response regulator transcription factor [Streptomyces sp. NBC_01455]